ncbi:MAG: hypothetical protein Ct9H300mP1_06760 [Planctomycetaceae bacterium]|nr:MAG: hypothetical protein Ct9H300mP1_06760 [Planctomycetaceae bacterium]
MLDQLDGFDWIVFTSANGGAGLLGRLWDIGADLRRLSNCRLAAIGPATAEALAGYRLRADLVPKSYRAEALGEAGVSTGRGGPRVVGPCQPGRDVLPEMLEKAGGESSATGGVPERGCGRVAPGTIERRAQTGRLDWIGLSSPSIARGVPRVWARGLGPT